jgi:DNA-binding CsgD family transcriptional regulator
MVLWTRNEFARAAQLLNEAETVARTSGDAGALAYARLHQGYVAAYRGDLDLAEARGEEALETGETNPQGFVFNGALWLLASAALARKEDTRAVALYKRLFASARTSGDDTSLANALYGQAVLAERRADLGPALAGFAEAAMVCRGYGDRIYGSHCLDAAAATAVALDHLEPAARLFAAADALRLEVGATPAQVFMAERQSLERALAAARTALGAERFDVAWAAGAGLTFDEALAEAAALVEQVSPPDSAHPSAAADGLTGREREILRLLAAGWPDKEIAAELGIGRRTVSNHVSAIRAKLDAPSRSAAAAVAVRDHLV